MQSPAAQPDTFVRVLLGVGTVGVLIGLGAMPYGYYLLLRLVLCGIALYLLFGAGLRLIDWQRWTLGAVAVLYNPLLPIRLGDKGLWTIVNVATLVLFGVVSFSRAQR